MTVETQDDTGSPPVAEVAPASQPLSAKPLAAEPIELQPAVAVPAPTVEAAPTPELTIAVAEPAPLVQAQTAAAAPPAGAPEATNQVLGLPLQLVNQLLAKLGAAPLESPPDLWPAVRLLSLLLAAGVAVKLTAATLGAINEMPLMGRLLELVGLISALNFLARNAVKSQKRAELLARITKLKHDLLG